MNIWRRADMIDKNPVQPNSNAPFKLGVSDFSTSEPLQNAEKIISAGMDFIEPGLAKIAAMEQSDFEQAAQRISQNQILVQSVNWFLPPTLKVTGPDVDPSASRQFLEHALPRATHLGAKAVVFGSPGSRSIPDGFSVEKGHKQFIDFCRLCSDVIKENQFDIRIALEHVNHSETNFMNKFADAYAIAREVDRPEIGLAADFYHFAMENEPMDLINEASDLICAVQLANPEGRCFPQPDAEIPELYEFFERLSAINFQGGVSVEATVGDDLEADCRAAKERLIACFESLK